MNTEEASEICYELTRDSSERGGCFSTSQFANRAGILGWGEPELIELLKTVPGIRRVSHSWWKLQSRMWRAVRNLGLAMIVAAALARLLL